MHCPVFVFHILAVLSQLPVAKMEGFVGWKATLVMRTVCLTVFSFVAFPPIFFDYANPMRNGRGAWVRKCVMLFSMCGWGVGGCT